MTNIGSVSVKMTGVRRNSAPSDSANTNLPANKKTNGYGVQRFIPYPEGTIYNLYENFIMAD